MATTVKKTVEQPKQLDELDKIQEEIADKKASEALDMKSEKKFTSNMEEHIANLESELADVHAIFLTDGVTYKFPKDKIDKLHMSIIKGELPERRIQLFKGAQFLVDRIPEVDTNIETELAKRGSKGTMPYRDVTGVTGHPLTEEQMKMDLTI